jgi:hypothetical protein
MERSARGEGENEISGAGEPSSPLLVGGGSRGITK